MRVTDGVAAIGILLASLTACTADRIERGVFHSAKGYRVALPTSGWRVEPDGQADLTLRHAEPAAGMLANATCSGKAPTRSLDLLSRHLLFGLIHRSPVEEHPIEVGERSGTRSVVRGERDGMQVGVEAVVLKDERCVYDFLYVAPAPQFAAGRADFDALVQSFSAEAPRER